jgi:hypothetical protein
LSEIFKRQADQSILSALRADRARAEDRVIFFEDRGEYGPRYDRAVGELEMIDAQLADVRPNDEKRQRID